MHVHIHRFVDLDRLVRAKTGRDANEEVVGMLALATYYEGKTDFVYCGFGLQVHQNEPNVIAVMLA